MNNIKNNKNIFIYIFVLMLALTPWSSAIAAPNDFVQVVLNALQNTTVATTLFDTATIWLGSFMIIQFVMTNIGLLKSGADIEAVLGKLIGSLLWFAFCIYILKNGPSLIGDIGDGVLDTYLPVGIATADTVLKTAFSAALALLGGALLAGTTLIGIGNSIAGQVLLYTAIFVIAVSAFMALKIMMLKLELGLIILMAPLSFSLLGLNALKDQGIAPFKSLLALVYRIIIMSIIFSAFNTLLTASRDEFVGLGSVISANGITGIKDTVELIITQAPNMILNFVLGSLALAFAAFKSDSIASSLASGTASLGTGDIAAAAAAGAAAGGAIASASSAVVGKTPAPAIPASVSNASSKGSGLSGLGGGGAPGLNTPIMSKPDINSTKSNNKDSNIARGNESDGSRNTQTPEQQHEAKTGETPEEAINNKSDSAARGALSQGGSDNSATAARNAAFRGGSASDIGAAVMTNGGNMNSAMAAAGNAAAGDLNGGNKGMEPGQLHAGVATMAKNGSASDAAKAMQASGATPIQAKRAADAMAIVRDDANRSKSLKNNNATLNAPPAGAVSAGQAGAGTLHPGSSRAAGAGAMGVGGSAGAMPHDQTPASMSAGAMGVGGSAGAVKAMQSGDATTPEQANNSAQSMAATRGSDSKSQLLRGSTTLNTPPAGSASGSQIQGGTSEVEQKIDKLAEQMAKQNQPRKATFSESVGKVNQHIEREKASTGVSINMNAGD